jgi:putative ABC transport system permease protein
MIAREFVSFAAGNLWRMKLRAGLTISGVVIGIGALVAMLSFANGVQRNVSGEFRKLGLFRTMQVFSGPAPALGERRAPHAPDSTKGPPLDGAALEKIAAIEGVALVYPQLAFDARIEGLGPAVNARVQGLPASFVTQRPFGEIQGRFFESDTAHEAVVRRPWLRRHQIDADSILGKTLTVRATGSGEILVLLATRELTRIGIPEAAVTTLSGVAKEILPILSGSPNRSFRVVGITDFESGFGFDMGSILVPIRAAERIDAISFSDPVELLTLLSEPAKGEWPLLVVTVTNERVYARVRAAIEAMGFHVFSFLDRFEEMRKSFLIFDAMVGAIGFLALFIASLSIVNTMVMSIIERTREIGILKSLGAEEGQIRLLFLVESGMIGLLGSLGGLLLGYAVSRVGSYILRRVMAAQQVPPVDLFCLSVWIALGAVAFGIAVSLAAGLYPAARAARIDPVQALRQE